MQNTNKILCNMSQSLTDAAKAQARNNIGAVCKAYYTADVLSHNITQNDAQNGYFGIMYPSSSQRFDGLLLCNVEMIVGAGSGIGNAVNPVVLRIKLTDSNNVEHTDTVSTGVLCRTSNDTDWRYVGTFFFDFSRISQYTFVSMKLEFYTGPYVIPQNTDVILSIQRDMIYYG